MRLRFRSRFLIPAASIAVFAVQSATAGEFAPAPPVQGMAIAPPAPGMANKAAPAGAPVHAPDPPASDPAQGRRRFEMLGTGFPATGGRLPNQRTGHRREHVVHDICIGC